MDHIKRLCEENEIECNHYPFMLENMNRKYKNIVFYKKSQKILWFHIHKFEKLINDIDSVLKLFEGFLRIVPFFKEKLLKYYDQDVKIVIIFYNDCIHIFPLSDLSELKMYQIFEKQFF